MLTGKTISLGLNPSFFLHLHERPQAGPVTPSTPTPILSPPVLPLTSGTKRPPQIPRTLWGWHTPGDGTGTPVLVSSSHCPTNSVSNPHPQPHSISSSSRQRSPRQLAQPGGCLSSSNLLPLYYEGTELYSPFSQQIFSAHWLYAILL